MLKETKSWYFIKWSTPNKLNLESGGNLEEKPIYLNLAINSIIILYIELYKSLTGTCHVCVCKIIKGSNTV